MSFQADNPVCRGDSICRVRDLILIECYNPAGRRGEERPHETLPITIISCLENLNRDLALQLHRPTSTDEKINEVYEEDRECVKEDFDGPLIM